MASGRRMSNDSSSSISQTSEDIHAFAEEEADVSVSVLKAELLAQFKSGMEAEINDMRESMLAMREEINRLRAERDGAVNEVLKLRELMKSTAPDAEAVNSTNTRTPPRKIAKAFSESSRSSVATEAFPALPARPTREAGSTNTLTNSAYAVPASTSKAAAAASASVGATSRSSTPKVAASSNPSSAIDVAKGYKKTLQAVNTDVFKVRAALTASAVKNFSVKQTSRKGPVKIVLTNQSEVLTAKSALSSAKLSFHEFKTPDERMRCYIIRGLVGATDEDLPFIKEELCGHGLPTNIAVSRHLTGFMRANPNNELSAPVKLVVPPNFDDKMLKDIKFLNHVAIRFELFKSKTIIQCKNCQGFGHSASGCQHEHRCVKCGQNHYRDTCPRTTDATHKLKCANCEGEHTANNLNNCPFFLERYGVKKTSAIPPQPASNPASAMPKPKKASSATQPGISYARAASANNRPSSEAVQLPRFNASNTNTNNNYTRNTRNDPMAVITNQLTLIMTKLEEHSQMWLNHDKCLNLLMSKLFSNE